MNLQSLRTILETTTGTNIKQVLFDFAPVLNDELDKQYPLVLWDIDNSTWKDNQRSGEQFISINIYVVAPFSHYNEDKILAWDSLEADLKEYLNVINGQDFIYVDLREVEKEYYPASLLTVDGEIGLRYRLPMKLWC